MLTDIQLSFITLAHRQTDEILEKGVANFITHPADQAYTYKTVGMFFPLALIRKQRLHQVPE